MNIRPSFDDSILDRVRTGSASSVAVRTFFQSWLKSAFVSFRGAVYVFLGCEAPVPESMTSSSSL